MLAVQCPQVRVGQGPEVRAGQVLVSERRIIGLAAGPDGFVVTVQCPCGQRHEVHAGRPAPLPEQPPAGTDAARTAGRRRWLIRRAA